MGYLAAQAMFTQYLTLRAPTKCALVQMALGTYDLPKAGAAPKGDRVPLRFSRGWEFVAIGMGYTNRLTPPGLDEDIDADELAALQAYRETAQRGVKRAIAELVKAGAIRPVGRPTFGRAAEYDLICEWPF